MAQAKVIWDAQSVYPFFSFMARFGKRKFTFA